MIIPPNIVRLRRTSQILFLALFFFLLFHTQDRFGANQLRYPLNSFFYFDPLVALSVLFSAHGFKKIFLLSLITIVLTLILGRFFCGWVCPLGSLNQFISYLNKKVFRRKKHEPYHKHQKTKYLIFIFLIVLSLLGINIIGILDPPCFLSRGITPIFQTAVSKIFRLLQYLNMHTGLFAHDRFFYWIQAYINYFHIPYYKYAVVTTFFLVVVLLLNLVVSRFWCRRFCPLGGLLGFLSRGSVLNLQQIKTCRNCLECTRNCEGACDPHRKGEWKKQECLYCGNCIASCPQGNLKFVIASKADFQKVDLSRRQLLYSVGASVIALLLIKIVITNQLNFRLIRPPGALEEHEFLRRCIRCSRCIKVCPTNFLHPILFEAGFSGIWTPYGVGSLGFCKYDCNLCGRVCPTGAIKNLALRDKQKTKIGTAFIDRGRCLPYSLGTACGLCYENCPLPGKAIESVEIEGGRGLRAPRVATQKCIGCGRCENVCPVRPSRAISLVTHKK